MADIRVQRGTVTLSAALTSVTLPTPVGSLSNAFVKINSTAVVGGDYQSSYTASNGRASVRARLTSTSTIEFYRSDTGVSLVVSWEVWEYVGPAGGPNEFVVHDLGLNSISGAVYTTAEVAADPARCTPVFSTADGASTADAPSMQVRAKVVTGSGGGAAIEFYRQARNTTLSVQAYLIEWTGSNWAVEQVEFNTGIQAGTNTVNIINSAPWSQKFIFHSVAGQSWFFFAPPNRDVSDRVRPGLTATTIDYLSPGARVALFHVISNPDINVQHISGTVTANTLDLTVTPVSALEDTGVLASVLDDYGTQAYHKYVWRYELASTSSVALRRYNNTGATQYYAVQVIEFPTSAPPPITGSGNAVTGVQGSGTASAVASAAGAAGVSVQTSGAGQALASARGSAGLSASGNGLAHVAVGGEGAGALNVEGAGAGAVPVGAAGSAATQLVGTGRANASVTGAGAASPNVQTLGHAATLVGAVGSASIDAGGRGVAVVFVSASGEAQAQVQSSGNGQVLVVAAGSWALDAQVVGFSAVHVVSAGAAALDTSTSGAVDVLVSGTGRASTYVQGTGTASAQLVAITGAGQASSSVTAAGTVAALTQAAGRASISVSTAGAASAYAQGAGNASLGVEGSGNAAAAITGHSASDTQVQGGGLGVVFIGGRGVAGASVSVSGVVNVFSAGSGGAALDVTGSGRGGKALYSLNAYNVTFTPAAVASVSISRQVDTAAAWSTSAVTSSTVTAVSSTSISVTGALRVSFKVGGAG